MVYSPWNQVHREICEHDGKTDEERYTGGRMPFRLAEAIRKAAAWAASGGPPPDEPEEVEGGEQQTKSEGEKGENGEKGQNGQTGEKGDGEERQRTSENENGNGESAHGKGEGGSDRSPATPEPLGSGHPGRVGVRLAEQRYVRSPLR